MHSGVVTFCKINLCRPVSRIIPPTQKYPCGIEWGSIRRWGRSSVKWQLPGRGLRLLYKSCNDTMPTCPIATRPPPIMNPNPNSTTPYVVPTPTTSASPRPPVTSSAEYSGDDKPSGDDEPTSDEESGIE